MNQVITVRASSWGSLFMCAYSWQGTHLLGIRKPSGLRAQLGTAIHAGTAAFDQAKLENKPISVNDAAEVLMKTLHNPDDEVDYKQDRSINMREAEKIGLTLHTKYCAEIAPQFEYKAVEMKMQPLEIDCGNGITIKLTGTMDRARVAKNHSGIVIPDIKTGSRIIENDEVALKGKSAQLGAYQLMYENTTDEITFGAQIIALPTTGKLEPKVSQVWDAKRVMIGTPEAPGFIELASNIFKTGMFYPNPQSPLCSQKFCARWERCTYKDG